MSARTLVRLSAIGVLFSLALPAQASTIIKLDLGSVGPDIRMIPPGNLNAAEDGIAATRGSQNTSIEFTDFLDTMPDITTPTASFYLNGLTVSGPAQQLGPIAIQNFTGGSFFLYDPGNKVLLAGFLTSSVLTGVTGPPGTASLFTTGLTTQIVGSLAPLIAPGTLSLSISMISVNGGAGLALVDGTLQSFVADASVLIAAVPEPSTLALLTVGAVGLLARRRYAR